MPQIRAAVILRNRLITRGFAHPQGDTPYLGQAMGAGPKTRMKTFSMSGTLHP